MTVTFGKSKKGDTAKMKAHGSGSNPGWSTNGGYGLINALGHSDFLLLIGSNPIASTKKS